MPKTTKTDFSKTEQDRSKKTLEDLLASAYLLVEEAKPEKFTSRELAQRLFVESNSISGTKEHRWIAKENLMRLLGR